MNNIHRRYMLLTGAFLAACVAGNALSYENAVVEQTTEPVVQTPLTSASTKIPTSDPSISVAEKHTKDTDTRKRLAYLSSIASKSKIACTNDTYENTVCTADGYTVDFGDCGDSLSYGGIAVTGGVTLLDQLTAHDAQPIARLENKQFVCIEATASKGGQERYYVKAVPVASVVGCKGNDLCKSYSDHPVQWIKPPSGKLCRLDAAAKSYTGDCPEGWIDGDALEEFSMGL